MDPRPLRARAVATATLPAAVLGIALAAGASAAAAAALALVAAALVALWIGRSYRMELRHLSARARSEAEAGRRGAEAERDRLATLVAELGDAILIVDRRDRVRLANPAAERMLAASPLVDRRLVEVVRDHEVLDVIARARGGAEASGQVERAQPQRLYRIVARPLPGDDVLLAIHDLSAMRRLETIRADFVANVSHELRTPIASLRAMAETLGAGAIDDRTAAHDFVSRMLEEIDGLAQLVEELLSLARIESGADRLALADLDPGGVLREAAHRMAPLAVRAGVSIHVEEEAADQPAVRGDPERIGQVLTNLLHNAVKFTPPGGSVVLRAEAGDGFVAFSVRDTGAGIDRGELDRVFERFYKGDRARATGGTGLGLAIVKHIVHAHGGEVGVESDGPGRGSTFTFTLPRADSPA